MSKRKKKTAPLFPKGKENIPTYGKNHPPISRKGLINQLAANLFLSVWQDDGCFDDIVDRIENDKHIPAQLKLDVFRKVIASIDGFVTRFKDHTTLDKEEVERWLNQDQ